jgi:hypothetical protein
VRFVVSWSGLRGSCLDRGVRAPGLARGRGHDLGRLACCLRVLEVVDDLGSARRRGLQPSDEAC